MNNIMKRHYLVYIKFYNLIFEEEVSASNKTEAYDKAKKKVFKREFKLSNLKRDSCDETC